MCLCDKALHVSRREGKGFKLVLGMPTWWIPLQCVEVQQHTILLDPSPEFPISYFADETIDDSRRNACLRAEIFLSRVRIRTSPTNKQSDLEKGWRRPFRYIRIFSFMRGHISL